MINHTEINPTQPVASSGPQKAKSRLRTYKRKQRRLKATIRQLREDLAKAEAAGLKYVWLTVDGRQKVKELQAVNKEIGDLAWEAEKQLHAAQKAASAVYEPLLSSFLALSKLMTAVSKSTL